MVDEQLRRWQLALGTDADKLSGEDLAMHQVLAALYDCDSSSPSLGGGRHGGFGSSSPRVTKWLGDIRTYFPRQVVEVMQSDAIERYNLQHLLAEPEVLSAAVPDMHLVTTLMTLGEAIPEESKSTARMVVGKLVDDIMERIAQETVSVVGGALRNRARTNRPQLGDIDWPATIQRNLGTYQPDLKTIIPEKLVGYGRGNSSVSQHLTLALDQSGSMGESVVYSAVFGAVLASLPTLSTRVVAFDTAVVDLTDDLQDPVDVLFGVQLGGGTDINGAIGYCQGHISEPENSIFVLVTDLYEGGIEKEMLSRLRAMRDAGVTVIVLLALSDDGVPSYDRDLARSVASLAIPTFACVPDAFPGLLATAIQGGDIQAYAEKLETK